MSAWSRQLRRTRHGRRAARPAAALLSLALLLPAAACRGDDERTLLPAAGAAQQGSNVILSDLRAGNVPAAAPETNPYEDDEHALAAGRALYASMNCAGCHGPEGGGGIGPPFAAADWIYGGEPENIVQAILQGRPNGMPAFGAKLPASEAWKIATYVKHLSKPAEQQQAKGGSSPTIGSAKGSSTAARGP